MMMRNIGSLRRDLVPLHHVHVGSQRGVQQRQLVRVVLRIAVRVKDQLFGRRLEAEPQRTAIPQRLALVRTAACCGRARQVFQHLHRVVSAAVLDDYHFVIVRQLGAGVERRQHHRSDRARIVICREKDRYARALESYQ